MKIQKRMVNTKRHTTHYKIGGKWVSRKDAVKLAQKGKLDGIRVCRCNSGHYIQSHPMAELKLYDLPVVIAG